MNFNVILKSKMISHIIANEFIWTQKFFNSTFHQNSLKFYQSVERGSSDLKPVKKRTILKNWKHLIINIEDIVKK
jgi:hypothetical protein